MQVILVFDNIFFIREIKNGILQIENYVFEELETIMQGLLFTRVEVFEVGLKDCVIVGRSFDLEHGDVDNGKDELREGFGDI